MKTLAVLAGLGALATASAFGAPGFHAGKLKVPDFDEVLMIHLGFSNQEKFSPYGFDGKEKHLFQLPKFHKAHGEAHHEHEQKGGLQRMNSVNEKLMEADMHKMVERKSAPKFHAGTWIKEESEDYPNLDIEPIGYSRQWMGEEKLGGGWSSAETPLSGDREYIIKKMKTMMSTDEEKEEAKGMKVTVDADGGAHCMPKKG